MRYPVAVDEQFHRQASEITAGLCPACEYVRMIESSRGSRFVLCERSKTDPAYPKYPPLPVIRCAGFVRKKA